MINITEVTDKQFGKFLKIENGKVELMVTLDFGPRIIYCSLCGHENMLYQDPEHKPLGEVYPEYGGDVHKLYGGHRLWTSPEILPRCYHPDNEPVVYEKTSEGVIFVAPIEKHSGLQKSIMVSMSDVESSIQIMHKITNRSLWELEVAPWAITMLAAGGIATIPISGLDTGVLPNRRIALWDYTNLADPRLKLGRDYILLSQMPDAKDAFKMGLFNHSGMAAYFNKGQVFIKYFDVIDGLFTDFGCNYEVYTNEHCLESETLGRLQMLAAGESVHHMEVWQLFKEDAMPKTEEDVKKIMKRVKNENN